MVKIFRVSIYTYHKEYGEAQKTILSIYEDQVMCLLAIPFGLTSKLAGGLFLGSLAIGAVTQLQVQAHKVANHTG